MPGSARLRDAAGAPCADTGPVKLKLFVLVLFAAGLLVGAAIAGNGKGNSGSNGKGKDAVTATTTASSTTSASSTTAASTTTTTSSKGKPTKVTLCHLTGSKTNPYVKIAVSSSAVKSQEAHGDVPPDSSGKCPATAPSSGKGKGKGGETTTTTATPTTTATTTTSSTTTTAASTTTTTTHA